MVASHLEDNLEADSCAVLATNPQEQDPGHGDGDGEGDGDGRGQDQGTKALPFPPHDSSPEGAAADRATATPPASSPEFAHQSHCGPISASSATVPRLLPRRGNKRVDFDRDWLKSLLRRHGAASLDREDADNNLGEGARSASERALRGRAIVAAPMVDQSDLPFRLLCRRYGIDLCYTPMIHADLFLNRQKYRDQFWDPAVAIPPADRPIVAQFAGSDPDALLRAARYFEKHVDAVDLNCGCPQNIAKRGRYGAFLLEDHFDDLVRCVGVLSAELSVPVAVKVRLLPPNAAAAGDEGGGDHVDQSIRLYHRLIDAGAAMITVHGRTRHQKQNLTGPVDWEAIRRVVDAVGGRVPIIANGGVSSLDDAAECIRRTGADGVMTAEAVLEYPPLFRRRPAGAGGGGGTPPPPSRVALAREYLDLCRAHPPHVGGQGSEVKCPKMHLHKFLHGHLQADPTLRDLAIGCKNLDDMGGLVDAVEEAGGRGRPAGGSLGAGGCGGGGGGDEGVGPDRLSWYVRHRHQHQHQHRNQCDGGGGTVAARLKGEEGFSAAGRGGVADVEHDAMLGATTTACGGAEAGITSPQAAARQCELDDDAARCAAALFDDGSMGDY